MMDDELTKKIKRKVRQYGSLRAAARALKINHSYLWKLQYGHNNNPSYKVLKKLGLIKTIR